MQLKRLSLVFLGLCVTFGGPEANAYKWIGSSNRHGGEVTYTQRHKGGEFGESYSLDFRCDGYDGRTLLRVMVDSKLEPLSSIQVTFEIDGQLFERRAIADTAGLFGVTPTVRLDRGDPLLPALMNGQSFTVFHDGMQLGQPGFSGHLGETHRILKQHLSLCLD